MIRKATPNDAQAVAELAVQMWDKQTVQALTGEFQEILSREDSCVFLKFEGDVPVGFAQCGLRHDYVEGTESSPVGYLEGIFVLESFRRKGYARELLASCEGWAREMGTAEFASDCELHNEDSLRFHQGMGFVEANRIICFVKRL